MSKVIQRTWTDFAFQHRTEVRQMWVGQVISLSTDHCCTCSCHLILLLLVFKHLKKYRNKKNIKQASIVSFYFYFQIIRWLVLGPNAPCDNYWMCKTFWTQWSYRICTMKNSLVKRYSLYIDTLCIPRFFMQLH